MLWGINLTFDVHRGRYISAKLEIGASRFMLNVRQENGGSKKEQAARRASASERPARGAKEARGTRCRVREKETERETEREKKRDNDTHRGGWLGECK